MIPTQVLQFKEMDRKGGREREREGETEKGRGTGRIWGDEVGEGEGCREWGGGGDRERKSDRQSWRDTETD